MAYIRFDPNTMNITWVSQTNFDDCVIKGEYLSLNTANQLYIRGEDYYNDIVEINRAINSLASRVSTLESSS